MKTKMRPALRRQLDKVNEAIARIAKYEVTPADSDPARSHADWVYSQWDRAIVARFRRELARAVRGSAGVPPDREQPEPFVYSKKVAQ